VLNKLDLLAAEDLPAERERLLGALRWDGPVFEVSAATGSGTEKLGQAVMRELAAMSEIETGASP
jgi:GTP-binding protein